MKRQVDARKSEFDDNRVLEAGKYFLNLARDYGDLFGPTSAIGQLGKLAPKDMSMEVIQKMIKNTEEQLKEEMATNDEYRNLRQSWKHLRQQVEDEIDKLKAKDDKFMADYEKQQKKNAEKMKKLTDKRDNLLLDIEDDYTQQGVDLLTSMGKAGKYMSAMELASLNQDRFSPITKKMDDM